MAILNFFENNQIKNYFLTFLPKHEIKLCSICSPCSYESYKKITEL